MLDINKIEVFDERFMLLAWQSLSEAVCDHLISSDLFDVNGSVSGLLAQLVLVDIDVS